jgi:hypothetical protein
MKNVVKRKIKSINEIKKYFSWYKDSSGNIAIVGPRSSVGINNGLTTWIVKSMMKKFGNGKYYEFVKSGDKYVCLDDDCFYLSEWLIENLDFGIEEYFEI